MRSSVRCRPVSLHSFWKQRVSLAPASSSVAVNLSGEVSAIIDDVSSIMTVAECCPGSADQPGVEVEGERGRGGEGLQERSREASPEGTTRLISDDGHARGVDAR